MSAISVTAYSLTAAVGRGCCRGRERWWQRWRHGWTGWADDDADGVSKQGSEQAANSATQAQLEAGQAAELHIQALGGAVLVITAGHRLAGAAGGCRRLGVEDARQQVQQRAGALACGRGDSLDAGPVSGWLPEHSDRPVALHTGIHLVAGGHGGLGQDSPLGRHHPAVPERKRPPLSGWGEAGQDEHECDAGQWQARGGHGARLAE